MRQLHIRYEFLAVAQPVAQHVCRLPAAQVEAVLVSLLRRLGRTAVTERKRAVLHALLGPSLAAGDRETVTRALFRKLLLVRVLPRGALDLLLGLVHSVSEKPEQLQLLDDEGGRKAKPVEACSMFSITLLQLLELWAQPSFLRHVELSQHMYLTAAIVHCLGLFGASYGATPAEVAAEAAGDEESGECAVELSPAMDDLPDEVSRLLMSGVQMRLADPINEVQTLAMAVAEAFSRLVDPTQPLNFGGGRSAWAQHNDENTWVAGGSLSLSLVEAEPGAEALELGLTTHERGGSDGTPVGCTKARAGPDDGLGDPDRLWLDDEAARDVEWDSHDDGTDSEGSERSSDAGFASDVDSLDAYDLEVSPRVLSMRVASFVALIPA